MIRTVTTPTDLTGVTASTAIDEFRFIEEVDSGDVKRATGTPGKRIVGVAPRGFASGEAVVAWPMGSVATVTAGTTLTHTTDAHRIITTDSQGRAIPWTAALGLPKLGRWLPQGRSLSAGDDAIVELMPPPGSAFGVISGTATIASGAATVDVALPVTFDGATAVQLTPQRSEAALGAPSYSWPSADGTLRITVAANAGADTVVAYRVEKEG